MAALMESEYRGLVDAVLDAALPPASSPASAGAELSRLRAAIEPTLLYPTTSLGDIDALCRQAAEWGSPAVCVNPSWVARAAAQLRGTPIAVAVTIGFPLGATVSSAKIHEAAECLKLGADELDVVPNLGALHSGAAYDGLVADEVAAICRIAHAAGARVKVIFELGALASDEAARLAHLALDAGADFLKTSTGTGPNADATVEQVRWLRQLAPPAVGIKAAGGIRSSAQALDLLRAGATRLGTSHPAAILGTV